MSDAAGKRICELLRRDDVLLAREAARQFLGNVGPASQAPLQGTSPNDEAEAILVDSFKQLVGVVALGLQVDEPRLVSEELQWLGTTVGTRFHREEVQGNVDLLIAALTGACRMSLSSEDYEVLEALLARARDGLSDVEPLLIDPRTQFRIENSTAQDK